MKFWVFILGLTLITAMGCQKENKTSQESSTKATSQELNITADMLAISLDPNCGMDMSKSVIKDTTVYNGKLYGFCSSGCKKAFLKDPEAKLAKLEAKHDHQHQ